MFFSGKCSKQLTDKSEIIKSVFLQNIGSIVAGFLLMSSNSYSGIEL